MAAPKTTPTKPSTPAAPPAASTSSWRDKFKDYFKSRDKSPPTQNTTDKTESKSVLSRIKDDTKDTVSKLVKLFVGSDEIDGFTKKTPPQKILKGIVKLLVEIETQKKLDYVNDRRTLKQEEREFNRRHKEILKALTVRRNLVKKKPTKKKATKEEEVVKKEVKPVECTLYEVSLSDFLKSLDTSFEFDIKLLNDSLKGVVEEWLNYGELRGISQWRNSGKGRFTWESVG